MSRLALAVFVLAAVAAEAHLSTWTWAAGQGDAPWQRLAASAPEPPELAQPARFDPFAVASQTQLAPSGPESRLAWSGDNHTLEEILGSAIWRASADCAHNGPCGMRGANTLMPL